MPETPRPTLLVVEDDLPIRMLMVRLAERAGFQVDQAGDGADALELLEHKSYDVAVVDLTMPRVSGYEVIRKLATMPPPMPDILVVTAVAEGDVSIDDTLVRRLIRKPFELGSMSSALAEAAREVIARRTASGMAIVPPADAILRPRDDPAAPAPLVASDAPAPALNLDVPPAQAEPVDSLVVPNETKPPDKQA